MEISDNTLIDIFDKANINFIRKNETLFKSQIAERTLCGALMIELYEEMKKYNDLDGYYVDVEYNRNHGTDPKRIINNNNRIISCDLIMHSRGTKEVDNLIAIEMKKTNAREELKNADIDRIIKMTSDLCKENEILNGHSKYVCGYKLGIFYEIDFRNERCVINYYVKGKKIKQRIINMFNNDCM